MARPQPSARRGFRLKPAFIHLDPRQELDGYRLSTWRVGQSERSVLEYSLRHGTGILDLTSARDVDARHAWAARAGIVQRWDVGHFSPSSPAPKPHSPSRSGGVQPSLSE